MNYRNIYKINNKYHIIKVLYNNKIAYGKFEDINKAIEKRDLLIRYDWIKCKTTGYNKNESFPKYIIRTIDDKHIIINKENGKTYGSYDNYKYAKIIKRILPYYQDKINIERVEKQAIAEFYKNITYNQLNNRYYIRYDGYTMATYRKLTTALAERDSIVKYGGDEELMCENQNLIYDYTKEKLPPFPKKSDNITYQGNYKNKYKLSKQFRNKLIIIGYYPSYDLTVLVKEYLDKYNWNKNVIDHIIHITQNIHKRNIHIYKRNKKYSVEKLVNNKIVYYGSYKTIEIAQYIRNCLDKDNWNKEQVKTYLNKYTKEASNSSVYYYDNTDFFKESTII